MFIMNIALQEIQLLFCASNFVNEDADPVSLISLTPHRAVELRDLLIRVISTYEEAFGTITSVPTTKTSSDEPPPNLH